MDLRRFWIELEGTDEWPRVPFGCGATAVDIDDALALIAEAFCDGNRPAVRRVVEDVDVGDLADELAEQIPGVLIGVPIGRGIWYPKGTAP